MWVWMTALLLIGSAGAVDAARAESYRGAFDQSFPPYSFVSPDGDPAGMHVEIVRGMFAGDRSTVELIGYPWNRLIRYTDTKQVDFSFPWREKPERFERYNMVGPFTPAGSRTALFQAKSRPIAWTSLSDLRGRIVGTVDGFAYPAEFENAVGLRKQATVSTEALLKMLVAGRIDLIISDEAVLWTAARGLALTDDVEFSGKPIDVARRYIAVPKDEVALARGLQEKLERFRTTGEYQAILDRYLQR